MLHFRLLCEIFAEGEVDVSFLVHIQEVEKIPGGGLRKDGHAVRVGRF